MKIFKKIGEWFKRAFATVKTDGAKVAIAITEGIQAALKSGVVGFLAKVIESIFPATHDIPEQAVAEINKLIPKVLATELAVQGLPDSPTEADILSFEQSVLQAFMVHDQKSKLYTVLASQIYGILQHHTQGTPFTFAELVADIEEAYQDYLKDLSENQ
jgi:hypothetical protein